MKRKSIDELIANKIYEAVNYVLSKKIKPDIKLEDVTEINLDKITELKGKYGIEGIILDVDDTLRKDMKSIPKCNEEWLDSIKEQLKVIVVSNGLDKNMDEFFKLKGIEYIGFAHKPLKKNFIKACKKMKIEPQNVLVVGDDLIDDIYGGHKNDMMTALVKNVKDDEGR